MKTVIFDFDGTIGNTLPIGLEIINNLADKYGFRKVTLEEVPNLQKMTVREVLKEFNISIPKALIIGRAVMKELSNNAELITVFNGIKDAIDDLKYRGYQVAIITKNDLKIVEKILEKAKISVDFLEHDSSFFNKEKVIESAIKGRGLDKSEVIYVGDEVRDVEAAQKAGIKIISVTWGLNSKEILEKNNEVIVEKPQQLVKKVKELLA